MVTWRGQAASTPRPQTSGVAVCPLLLHSMLRGSLRHHGGSVPPQLHLLEEPQKGTRIPGGRTEGPGEQIVTLDQGRPLSGSLLKIPQGVLSRWGEPGPSIK